MEYNNIDLIQSKGEKLLSELKQDGDASFLSTAQILLVILFSIAVILLFIVDVNSSVSKYLLFMVTLLGLLIWHRIKLNREVKESLTLSTYAQIEASDKKNYTIGLLKYLSSGYAIKLTRLRSIRLFFSIIFPLLLVLFKEVYQYFYYDGQLGSNIGHYILAFVIGASFWYYYFQSDINELELDKADVDSMISKLHL